MEETMIQELIDIHAGYTSYVDLTLELFDPARNFERMSQYRPIASHRRAFEKLARSLNIRDKRCYLLTGTYGTGKSHLCLMFANYMQLPASEPPMPAFFANYASENPQEAETLKARRQSGCYLVALCSWGVNDDFVEVVLRAIDEALKRAEFGDTLETPYILAQKKIREWKNFAQEGDPKGRFYSEFEQVLLERNPGQTFARFVQRLESFDASALDEFKQIHAEITTAPFSYYDKSHLIAILKSMLASKAFKDRFSGLLVLFDEFGSEMERGHMNPKAFQQFAQFCAETPSTCAPIAFVGTAHKSLMDYAKPYNTMEFRTASDRIEEISLDPDGVEDIIGAIVHLKKASPLWQQKIVPQSQTFDRMLQDCTRLRLFTWLSVPKVRTKIIENIYPMHPMATFTLLRLAQDVASNNRTVYTFFTDDAPGSFREYINSTPIQTQEKINLYPADRLFDYFSAKLQSDNKELRETVREYIKDYESSVREQKRVAAQDEDHRLLYLEDPLIPRILRLMLIYQFVQIANKPENLQFGLYLTTSSEHRNLQNRLRDLTEKGILYYIKDQDIYEFKQSKAVNIDVLIDEYKRTPSHMPTSLVSEIHALVPLDKKDQYLDAKDYNQSYAEDKRLDRRFIRAIDIDTYQGEEAYFDRLDAEISKSDDFEGIALYVLCETQEDIQKAKSACSKNVSLRIVVAIPVQPVPMLDAVLELRALQALEESEEAKNFSHQDSAALNARLNGEKGAKKALVRLRNKLLDNREVTWHGRYSQVILVEQGKYYDVANKVMEYIYAQSRNKFRHDDLNKLHHKTDLRKNYALKEAIERLLDLSNQIIIDMSVAQNRGDHKYLDKCLLQNNVLKVIKTEETKIHCDLEVNPQRYEDKLPALAEMVREVRNLKEGQKVGIGEWVKKYRKAPYGQGPLSLALSLAYLRRLFGDSIRIKPSESALIDLTVTSLDVLVDLIEGQYPNAFLCYRQLLSEERAFINIIYRLFSVSDAVVTYNHTVIESYNVLKRWWKSLLPASRIASIYTKSQYPYTTDFLNAMESMERKDAYAFLFDDIPIVFGEDAGTMMTKDLLQTMEELLRQEKEVLESGLSLIENRIIEKVRTLFDVEQSDYGHILDGIRQWYSSLDNNQRDTHAKWHTKDSKPLLLHVPKIENLEETFLKKIPGSAEYNLKVVEQWTTDRTREYTDRLERGKKLIDDQRIKVEGVQLIFEGDYQQKTNNTIYFKDKIIITFKHANPATKIYVTEGNTADLVDTSVARQQLSHGEQLVIDENKTLQVAAQDQDGNWSLKQTIKFFNEKAKHEIRVPPKTKQRLEEEISIIFPTDSDSFAVTCQSLFIQSLKRQVLTRGQLTEIVQALLANLGRDE